MPYRKVLIIRLSALGDVAMTIPVVNSCFSFRPLSITATRIPHNLKKKRNTFVRNTSCKSATASMDNRRTSRAR